MQVESSCAITEQLIHDAVHHAAHLLPAQGPITVFIHHNTLHAMEDMHFEDAVRRAAELFGGQPYLSEQRYREELAAGRITAHDINTVLMDDLGEQADAFVGLLGTRYSLRRAILRHPMHTVLPNQLEWVISESRAFERFSVEANPEEAQRTIANTRQWVTRVLGGSSGSDLASFQKLCQPLSARFNLQKSGTWSESTWQSFTLSLLWQICLNQVAKFPHSKRNEHPLRHRDYLYSQTGIDSDSLVNEVLIRFCVAMLDQGLSRWQIPGRNGGIFATFVGLYCDPQPLGHVWLRPLSAELRRIKNAGMTAVQVIQESLEALGVEADEVEDFVTQTLLSLRGFGGMIWQMEIRGDRIAHGLPPGSLLELLAIRMILERLALAFVARTELRWRLPLADIRRLNYHRDNDNPWESVRCESFVVFEIAQALVWQPELLFRLSSQNWHLLLEEIRAFDDIDRRKIFHLAYERRYRQQCLDALQLHCQDGRFAEQRDDSIPPPRFDVITCLDEREESFRRHLEEIEPQSRTWATAGFFGVAMYYCAADSFQFVPLCPIVIEPQHYVQEVVKLDQVQIAERRTTLRRILGRTQHRLHSGSRSLMSGALTAILGVLATAPLVGRVLFPRIAGIIRDGFSRFHAVPSQTALHLERVGETPGRYEHEIGFSLDEMAGLVERTLRVMGFTKNWSRLVIVLGHGSTNMNNPHASAYDCGACGGGRGGPNARAFTQMANDPRVRIRLESRGFKLPDTTIFVGGFHNTCNDTVTLLDLGNVPASHKSVVQYAQKVLEETCARNAHERCRRFESADLSLNPRAAFRHVMGRSEDLSQVRPECGHATNANCIVGRRKFTKGLYMDRRAFLHSYDPTQDDKDHSILAAILGAIFPVCGGINLEYYFSHVDPECYGCGTKLPHNIASLVGVMNGAASDLRPGLPWQMVEIHEPIRLLILVETTPEAIFSIMSRNPAIDRMIRGNWVQIAVFEGDTGEILLLQNSRFIPHSLESDHLPQSPSSINWYQGLRGHLGFAQIVPDSSSIASGGDS